MARAESAMLGDLEVIGARSFFVDCHCVRKEVQVAALHVLCRRTTSGLCSTSEHNACTRSALGYYPYQ